MNVVHRRRAGRVAATAAACALLCAALGPAHAGLRRAGNGLELDAALKAAGAGDTVMLAAGTWTDVQVCIRNSGTPERPLVVMAEEGGKTVLNGASQLQIGGSNVVVDGLLFKGGALESGSVIEFRDGSSAEAVGSRLTNCAVIDYNPPDDRTEYKWVSLYGRRNRVDHCFFEGKNHQGCLLVVWLDEVPDSHRVDRNLFGRRPLLGRNGAEIIRIGTSDWSMHNSRTVVEENVFVECDGEHEIISNKSCENVYRGNTFIRSKGALTLRHGNRCVVEGNFFFGEGVDSTGGVRIIGEDHRVYNNYFQDLRGTGFYSALSMVLGIPDGPLNGYFQVKNAQVVFNTFVHCRKALTVGFVRDRAEATLPPLGCVVANNVILGDGGSLIEELAAPVGMRYEANVMNGGQVILKVPAPMPLKDPRLEKSPDGLWRPAAGSPARGAAAGAFPYVAEDMDGQPRPERKDAGADQASDAPVRRKPLVPSETGPPWMHRN